MLYLQTPDSTRCSGSSAQGDRRQTELRVDFDALAKAHSADSFAAKGGYVGITAEAPSTRTHRGSLCNPSRPNQCPLDDGLFWRILRVEKRVGQSAPSHEKLEEEVDKRLSIEKCQKNMESWLLKLRRDANVRICDTDSQRPENQTGGCPILIPVLR